MPGGYASGYPKGVYGVGYRQDLFSGEDEYFRKNPHVTGMAADDDQIILNPYSKLTDKEKESVMLNEAARVHMRRRLLPPPQFVLTPEQEEQLKGYSTNQDDVRQTLAARILSGDPSAGTPTPEQTEYVQRLRQLMGVK